MKRFIAICFIALFTVIVMVVLRRPILQLAATALIYEDSLQKTDAVFVLSGGGYDRGNEAAKIYFNGFKSPIICTGSNPVVELKVLNLDTLESEMTAANLRRLGIPDSHIVLLRNGTSTREEAELIYQYCITHKLKSITLLSSRLHTARVHRVFRERFKKSSTAAFIHGAPSSRFDEMQWWTDEEGLISVNNEWIKTIYYLIKY